MRILKYTIIFEKECGGGQHVSSCPTLKGYNSQSDANDEALINTQNGFKLYLDKLIAHNKPKPEDDTL